MSGKLEALRQLKPLGISLVVEFRVLSTLQNTLFRYFLDLKNDIFVKKN